MLPSAIAGALEKTQNINSQRQRQLSMTDYIVSNLKPLPGQERFQDDEADWQKESVKMAEIYSKACLTICVIRGGSCLTGFLDRPPSQRVVNMPFQSTVDPSITGIYSLSRGVNQPELSGNAIKNSIWSTRCWTYQESLFSPRKLFFGDMIHYRGKEYFESETGIVLAYGIEGIPAQGPDGKFETRAWYSTVQQYTSKGLTKSTDRLPAISAIARRVSSIIRTDYLAGLWLSDIQHGLFWTTGGGTTTLDEYLNPKKPYVAPSWSWASYPGSVFWAHPISGTIQYRPEYILEKAEVKVPGQNPFGCPTDGCL
ncbi:HET-domain-containing protein [Penicillium malachiteum]|nr:HET-domain-containing protein [Penicillium malachiteum]